MEEYLDLLSVAGFSDVQVHGSYDVFKDARVAKSAAYFGARGVNIKGNKSH